MEVRHHTVVTPVGPLLLAVDCLGAVICVHFLEAGEEPAGVLARLGPPRPDRAATAELERQLAEYFDGLRHEFELTLAPRGTPFQQTVWAHIQAIGYGRTATYGEIATRLGRHTAARAVGGAIAANPIPIVIPCHRVLGDAGSLVGYGAGLAVKRRLLRLEGVPVPEQASLDLE